MAIELELEAVAAYHQAQLELQDRELLSLCARIMASEGQHLALLRSLADESPVPHAFERGVA
jgi:rubrerythrin